MLPAQILEFQRRIVDATRFRELVEIDRDLLALQESGEATATTVQYFREAVELRANPTVYAAFLRKAESEQIPGVDPDEGSESSALDPRAVDPTDEESLEAFVKEALERNMPKLWTEVESDNATTQDLAADPVVMGFIETVEAEESGVFPDTRPEVAAILKALANVGDVDDIPSALQAAMPADRGTLLDAEKAQIQEYAARRVAVLRGADGNADLIGFRRRARAMGVSPETLVEVDRLRAAQDLPNVYRSMVEIVHEMRPDMEALADLDSSENPKPFIQMQERLNSLLETRIADKRRVDRALNDLTGGGDGSASRGGKGR